MNIIIVALFLYCLWTTVLLGEYEERLENLEEGVEEANDWAITAYNSRSDLRADYEWLDHRHDSLESHLARLAAQIEELKKVVR